MRLLKGLHPIISPTPELAPYQYRRATSVSRTFIAARSMPTTARSGINPPSTERTKRAIFTARQAAELESAAAAEWFTNSRRKPMANGNTACFTNSTSTTEATPAAASSSTKKENLYGTANIGGASVVFEITP